MPGRKYGAGNLYRYGFNGKERDTDSPVQYDYGFRIYDPRLVRFKSTDPLATSFPWNSPYSYAEGDLIRSIDLDGLEKYVVTYWYNKSNEHTKTTIKAIRRRDTKKVVELNFITANGRPLTYSDVHVRHLYTDGTFKEHVPDRNSLSPEEHILFNKAKSRRSNVSPDLMIYTLSDQKGGAKIESEGYNPLTHEYRETQERSFNGKYALTAVGRTDMIGTIKNGTVDMNAVDQGFKDLLESIKTDGGYENGTVDLTLNTENASDKEFAAFERGVKYQGQQIKELLEKAGVKNVNVTTKATRGLGFANNGVKIKINN